MPYALRPIGFISPTDQLVLLAILFVALTTIYYLEYRSTGKISKYYPLGISILFAPIYEEIIFRGFILYGFVTIYTIPAAIILSSLLFGLWHLKNIFWLPKEKLSWQMIYTGIIFGPLMALITIWSGTIWLAVILHYLNNLSAAILNKNKK